MGPPSSRTRTRRTPRRTSAIAPRTDDPGILAATLIHGLVGKEADLKQHLLSLAAPTRAEAGCLAYDLYQSPAQPHEFLRVERWASVDALERPKQTPHLRASFDKRQREGWTTQIHVFQRVPEDLAATAGAVIERLDPRLDALLPPGARLDVVVEDNDWSEGSVWDARDGSLLYSDVLRNGVFRWKEGAGVAQFLRGSGYTGGAPFEGREPGSNGLAFDREGRLLLCQHGDRRVVRREPDGRVTVLAERYRGKRLNSPNDLVVGPDGATLYVSNAQHARPVGIVSCIRSHRGTAAGSWGVLAIWRPVGVKARNAGLGLRSGTSRWRVRAHGGACVAMSRTPRRARSVRRSLGGYRRG